MSARRLTPLLALFPALASCPGSLPIIDPAAFACASDHVLKSGDLPCPEADWCKDAQCTPRLGCNIPMAARQGCDPDRKCELMFMGCMRCNAKINVETDAVVCESGVHTSTSVHPKDLAACTCPDGTYCAAIEAGTPSDAYPLYMLPQGGAQLVSSAFMKSIAFTKEDPDWRMCVRACSSELDCSANHTCRAAPVVTDDLIAHPKSTRHTIGLCYPDRVVPTSSTATIAQPNPLACDDQFQCAQRGETGPCQYRVVAISDHPVVPAGAAWGVHNAMIASCVGAGTGASLVADDLGCTKGAQCASGVCQSGRCAKPCDPRRAGSCPGSRRCNDVLTSRDLPDGTVLEDRVRVCSAP
jgi:hypothetical protein